MVNTFLVHADYAISAKHLDNRRLAKQRIETQQIIDALTALEAGNTSAGWVNHPATRSWRGHLDALKLYFNAVVTEWVNRGYNNNYELYTDLPTSISHPHWVTSSKLHYSHMAQLIQKDPLYYSVENLQDKIPPELLTYFQSLPPEYLKMGYIWPYKYTAEQLATLPPSQLTEPYVERVRCGHPNCRNKASYADRCGVHRDKSIVIGPCQGVYKNGNACRSKAKYGSQFCGSHGGVVTSASSSPVPMVIDHVGVVVPGGCQAICKNGNACRNKAKYGEYCGVHRVK